MAHPLLKPGAEGNELLSRGKLFSKTGIPHYGRFLHVPVSSQEVTSACFPYTSYPGNCEHKVNFMENPVSIDTSDFPGNRYAGKQTIAVEHKEAIGFVKYLRFLELGMIHPETIERSPAGNNPNSD